MKDILISVPDKEYPFFMKLVKQFDFVTIRDTKDSAPSKKQFLDGIREAVEEVNDIKAGKKKGQSLKDFLNEL
jgi:hypothetical protein